MPAHDVVYKAPEGRGFSADDLHDMHLKQIRERLDEVVPELRERGVKMALDELRQAAASATFDRELVEKLNGESVRLAKELFRKEAQQILLQEQAQAALAVERPTPTLTRSSGKR